jgi:hypothetical protein
MQEASLEGLCRQRRAVVPRGEGLPLGSFDEAWGVILRPGIAGGWGVGTSDRIVLICTSDCSDQRGSPTEQFAYFDIYIDSLERGVEQLKGCVVCGKAGRHQPVRLIGGCLLLL